MFGVGTWEKFLILFYFVFCNMKTWFKGGFIGAIIVLVILNSFMWYSVISIIFNLGGTLITWFIGILLFPLYLLVKIIFGTIIEGSWALIIISAFLYMLFGFAIGSFIELIRQRIKSKK